MMRKALGFLIILALFGIFGFLYYTSSFHVNFNYSPPMHEYDWALSPYVYFPIITNGAVNCFSSIFLMSGIVIAIFSLGHLATSLILDNGREKDKG